MKLVGLMPVRNEGWILGLSARVALRWCDALVILDHASTDESVAIEAELVREYGEGRVTLLRDPRPVWDEMNHRDVMLRAARGIDATHIAIVDADEALTANLLDGIRATVEALPPGYMIQLPGYNLRGGLYRYHTTGIWSERWFSVAFADHPQLHWAGDRFHHREPMGRSLRVIFPYGQEDGGVMHLWGASERRLIAKHALYKMTEVLRWPDKPRAEIDRTYSLAFNPALALQFAQQWRYDVTPDEWWGGYADLIRHVDLERVPWQEAECARLFAEHGAQKFAGLDLFGLESNEVAA